MNPVSRGIRNAFRNGIRTTSIVLILGLSIGLSLTMLVAQKAVDNKIKSVKSSIGNTITIAPAGFNPGSQANNALTSSQLKKVQALAHVSNVAETLSDRLPTTGSSTPSFGGRTGSSSGSTTSLNSPTTLNFGSGNGGGRFFVNGGAASGTAPTNFSLPVSFLGTTNPSTVDDTTLTLKSGTAINGTSDTDTALISDKMASKNNLKVGSTFTAYDTKLTVTGIFSTSNQAAQGTVILSLPTLQRLSGQSGAVTSATATVDSLDNLSPVTSAIKKTLGTSADVTSAEEQADSTVAPLNSVKTVSTFSLIGAVLAGAIIILLTMIMIVRERKKEIGVVKAIGGSNLRIISEFMVESLTLAILGAIVGLLIGVIGGQPVTKMLVNNSTSTPSSSSSVQTTGFQRAGGGNFGGDFGGQRSAVATNRPAGGFGGRIRSNGAVKSLSNIKAQVGWSILLEGFGAAVLIAVVGSALSAAMISRVRPSIVMRAE